MRKILYNILAATITLLTLSMCKNTEPIDVSIDVTPGIENILALQSGEKTLYKVKAKTANSALTSLKITSFDSQNGIQTLKDSTLNVRDLEYSYVFTAPELNKEKSEVKITFEVTDTEGKTANTVRKINVRGQAIAIAEQTGIILSAPGTGLPDALVLADVSRPFVLAEAPRPDTADVYIQANPDFENITMRSNTETKFIRINNFNYSNASATTIKAVYTGSVPTDYVSDIQVNDIILAGHENTARGAFMIADIVRGATPYIRLNYKGIQTSGK